MNVKKNTQNPITILDEQKKAIQSIILMCVSEMCAMFMQECYFGKSEKIIFCYVWR